MRTGIALLAASLLLGAASLAAEDGKLMTMTGTVVSAEAKAGSIRVRADRGAGRSEEVTVSVASDVKIIKAGRKIPLSAVTAGERVTVNYRVVEGKNQAVSIGVETTS